MSIELDWSTVDYELTRSVHRFLADAFADTALPDFVGPVSVDHFSFGDQHPDVQILDITDIDKQFILDDGDHLDHLPRDDDGHHRSPPPPRSRSRSPTASYLVRDEQPPPPRPPHAQSSAPSPSFQLLVRVAYAGNLSLALSTSLRINYPSPAFMALPLRLALTDLAFRAVLVVAFEGGRNRVHISLVEEPPPPPPPVVNAAAAATDLPASLASSMMTATTARNSTGAAAAATKARTKERFLRSAHIESQVGNADKHVLRNVGKVEKFVLDVARTTLENELVFPNFQTILF
ncbi:hypothetical protein JCM3774_002766 [Rhodotorula dairenensis]